jgi:hypothetical protein
MALFNGNVFGYPEFNTGVILGGGGTGSAAGARYEFKKSPFDEFQAVPVSSSLIEGAGYQPASRTLRVRLHDGAIYDYHNVSERTMGFFTKSKSAGSFLKNNIEKQHTFGKIKSGYKNRKVKN